MLLDQIFRGASLSGGKLIAQFCQREGVTEEAFRFGLIGLYGRNREAPCWDGAVETIDAAKAAALADAGLAESDVTFTKEKLDWDEGIAVYDIEFLTADTEYDYEIDAATGAVLDKSAELLRPNESPGQAIDAGIGVESAKEIAAAACRRRRHSSRKRSWNWSTAAPSTKSSSTTTGSSTNIP